MLAESSNNSDDIEVSASHDPSNIAFRIGPVWYRIADCDSSAVLDELLRRQDLETSTVLERVVPFNKVSYEDSKKILSIYSQHAKRSLPAEPRVFRVESIPLILYPWEMTDRQLREAAQFTLDLRIELLKLGFDIKDASAYNVQFVSGKPILLDIGSLTRWDNSSGWCALRQFVEHFVNPLSVGQNPRVCAADAWMLGCGGGLRSEVARDLLPVRAKMNPRLKVLHLAVTPKASPKPQASRSKPRSEVDPNWSLRATLRLTENLHRVVRKASSWHRRDTTWSSYSARTHYSKQNLGRKYELLRDFILENVPQCHTVLDIGSNDGATAHKLIQDFSCHVAALDSDIGSLEILEASLEAFPNTKLRITPIRADILRSSFFKTLIGSEYRSMSERIRPDVIVCEAVLHHLVITAGKPLSDVIRILRSFGPLLYLEVPTENDEKVKQLISQIHFWKGDYSVERITAELKREYALVEILGKINDTRVVIGARA